MCPAVGGQAGQAEKTWFAQSCSHFLSLLVLQTGGCSSAVAPHLPPTPWPLALAVPELLSVRCALRLHLPLGAPAMNSAFGIAQPSTWLTFWWLPLLCAWAFLHGLFCHRFCLVPAAIFPVRWLSKPQTLCTYLKSLCCSEPGKRRCWGFVSVTPVARLRQGSSWSQAAETF